MRRATAGETGDLGWEPLIRRRRRAGILVALADAAALCGGAAPAPAAPVRTAGLACVDARAVAALKRDPAGTFPRLARTCAPQVRRRLGPAFATVSPGARTFALAAVAAHRMSAYGPSTVFDLPSLAALPALDCGGYAALAWHLARVAGADVRHARIVGWDGGPVGNHAQLAYLEPGSELVLDPTVGLVARASLAQLLAGAPVSVEHLVQVARPATPDPLAELRDMVTSTLHLGQFGPGSLIYEHPHPPGQGAAHAQAVARLEAPPVTVRLRAIPMLRPRT